MDEKSEQRKMYRRIIAEDPEWNLAPVEKLETLCIQVLVRNFQTNPVIKKIPQKYRDRIIASISTDIPLSIAGPLIPDENYWEKRSKKRFKLARVVDFGNSWKRLFFELHIRESIENYKPSLDGSSAEKLQTLLQEVKLGAPFIRKLAIRQLNPIEPLVVFDPHGPILDNKSQLTDLMNEVSPDHIDLSSILSQLDNLTDFSVYYGINLSSALGTCQLLKLTITASQIDDDRCRILANALAKNTTIQRLDLSHNKIGNLGSKALATILVLQKTVQELVLANNKIQSEGAEYLGKALEMNTTLRVLDLRLNRILDVGGNILLNLLKNNNGLCSLDLSGNSLSVKSATALGSLLKRNNEKLTRLDVSCNKLAGLNTSEDQKQQQVDTVGKMLLESISLNKVFEV